ncbi:hypothetical protein GCM10011316_12570 [Roseibium aquae]|uniref:Uncharacterized protein n=1 Tax=Roseibium aquae TaxID=1323746 RepID=A0A916TF60_9HYPH|nr:hypothetical protein [Roseibium aquae]GGB42137.1 hypothetical protein GCM10011316_12570 [Roseibium aquae]
MAPPPSSEPVKSDRNSRILALAIALAALALMLWIGRHDVPGLRTVWAGLSGSGAEQTGTGNPELDACLAQRVGDVDKMRDEGVITPAQHQSFKARAVSFCEAQFPPAQ